MVIPAYLYDDQEMHEVVIVGELLAIAAIAVCLAFVVVDMGRPDRLWHMLPIVGRFHWPMSMLAWDVIVLNGYLLLNLHITGYTIYSRFIRKPLNPRWYVPFVFVSVVWAISIHTVTAFLYTGLGSRPFWNDAIIAAAKKALITGDPDTVGEILENAVSKGLDGIAVDLPVNGHNTERIELLGQIANKILR